jgi:hypothetical protein
LITKENVLMITQDSKAKDERFLTLDVNVAGLGSAGGNLEGNG